MSRIVLIIEILGTISFAVSGALTAIRHKMDVFGVAMLAVITATGGGVLRDIFIGHLPPASFLNPVYVMLSCVTGLMTFLVLSFHDTRLQKLEDASQIWLLFLDTLGVAAFTADGVTIGLHAGFQDNLFLLVFIGAVTGVGGGLIRDILANQMPDILCRHVYALATIRGAAVYALLSRAGLSMHTGMISCFVTVVVIRALAVRFHWNLPRLDDTPT